VKWLFRLFTSILLCFLIWASGFLWFALQIPSQQAINPSADIIVALTGGSGRLDYSLQLLADKRADSLFVSGVSEGVTVKDIIHQASPKLRSAFEIISAPPIYLGDNAKNTIGNAEETRSWFKNNTYKSMILVTSNYHMPRSLSEFHEVLPGVIIIPAPVFMGDFKTQGWLFNEDSRKLIFSEYHKYIVSKLRHLFVSATQKP